MYQFLFKFVIVGDKNTGKTSLIKNYVNTIIPTIGVDFFSTNIILDNKDIKLHIWDTSGNRNFLNIISVYFKNAIGVVVVFSLSDYQSFNNIDFWINQINSSNNDYKNIILIGNKHKNYSKIVSDEDIKKKCYEYNLIYFEADENFIIQNCFIKMCNNILSDFKKKPYLFRNLEGFKNNMPILVTTDYLNFDNDLVDEEPKHLCCKNYCSIS